MNEVILTALERAQERIQCEDWQGTCACDAAWKAAGRVGLCPCAQEHQDMLDLMDAALQEIQSKSDGLTHV